MKTNQSQGRAERLPSLGSSKLVPRDFLSRQCVQFQKRRAHIVGPLMLGVSIWGWWMTRAWQLGVIAGVMVLTNALFLQGLREAKKGAIEKSLWMAVIPTLVTCMSVVTLIDRRIRCGAHVDGDFAGGAGIGFFKADFAGGVYRNIDHRDYRTVACEWPVVQQVAGATDDNGDCRFRGGGDDGHPVLGISSETS